MGVGHCVACCFGYKCLEGSGRGWVGGAGVEAWACGTSLLMDNYDDFEGYCNFQVGVQGIPNVCHLDV